MVENVAVVWPGHKGLGELTKILTGDGDVAVDIVIALLVTVLSISQVVLGVIITETASPSASCEGLNDDDVAPETFAPLICQA